MLVVVDNNYYQNSRTKVDRYVSEVKSIEGLNTELLVWNWNKGLDVRSACFPLWQTLQQKYVTQRTTADPLKGAVFIGQLPVPMFRHCQHTWDTVLLKLDTVVLKDFPHDYYFMDLWDQNTSTAYPIDTLIWPYSQEENIFLSMLENSPGYRYYEGDSKLDIWVTRVMAEYLSHVRDGTTELTEFQILDQYLDKVHARMTATALVPPRSFSMSGITEWLHLPGNLPDDVLCLDKLKLPFHTRFEHPHNNPANFISQLQSGPRGNVNYGSYFGTRYRSERNRRDCTWGSLYNVTKGLWEYSLDTLGYEWAGVYEHGSPDGFVCNGVAHEGPFKDFTGLNGILLNYNIAPMVDSTKLIIDANGYNGSYYRFSNLDFPASPWGWGPEWRGRDASWKAYLATKGEYNIYIYYVASSLNTGNVEIRLAQNPINNYGVITGIGSTSISQKAHASPETPGSNWEFLGRYAFTTFRDTAVVKMVTNGVADGRFIIDAVKFVGVPGTATQGIQVIVDEQSPNFSFPDWNSRSLMDIQDEDMESHKKYSKVPFFLANSCHLNEYSNVTGGAGNNVGLLMAMTQNGLISMGSINSNDRARKYLGFISAINKGQCFGDAFLSYVNTESGLSDVSFIMLGAGTLKAQAYVNYGSTLMRDYTLANGMFNYETPLHLINVSTIAGRISTIITNKEIRIAPETVFNRGSTVNLVVR